MDALPSRRQGDGIAARPPSLLDPSDDGSKIESPVFKLPTEITMLVFQAYRSFSGPPIALMHTCRRWRQIAINDAYLWTKISIHTPQRSRRLDGFLSFLGMQFDRSANLLLDVRWHAVFADEAFLATLQLIREKAPFSRWKTLLVDISPGQHEGVRWSSVDAFTNLESLTIWACREETILGVIDRTITQRLKVLCLPSLDMDIIGPFAKSLTHISSIHFERFSWNRPTSFLAANIINLRIDDGVASTHTFPHIQTYEVNQCIFFQASSIELRNMTTFTVKERLTIRCKVFLPALRELTLGTLRIYDNADIKSPALDLLHFTDCDEGYIGFAFTEEALKRPGYQLSPNTSLIVDSWLPTTSLINLLSKSPKITHATVRFDGWAGVQAVLGRLVGFGTCADSHSANVGLCPRLSELRLDFGRADSDPPASEGWILDRLKARREAGVTPPLSIYVRWEGEGTYVLLTGD